MMEDTGDGQSRLKRAYIKVYYYYFLLSQLELRSYIPIFSAGIIQSAGGKKSKKNSLSPSELSELHGEKGTNYFRCNGSFWSWWEVWRSI